MININKQKEAIIELGNNLSNTTFKEHGLKPLADSWTPSREHLNLLGENGKVEIDWTLTTSSLDYKSKEINNLKVKLTMLLQNMFKGKVKGMHPYASTMDGKLNISVGFAGTDDEFQSLGTFNKTFKKLMRTYLSKDEINKLNKEIAEIEELRTELEQILSQKVTKNGKLVISALPQDILTASVSGYNWNSCFAPDSSHEISPFGYLKNGIAMIAYFVPDDSDKLEYSFGKIDKKMWRTWIFISDDNNIVFPADQYPSPSEKTFNKVTEYFLNQRGEGYELKPASIKTVDSLYFDKLNKSISKIGSGYNDKIGLDNFKCPMTNKDLNKYRCSAQSLVDLESLGFVTCESCDDHFQEDDMLIARNSYGMEYYICPDCSDEYVYSELEDVFIYFEVAAIYTNCEADGISYAFADTLLSSNSEMHLLTFEGEIELYVIDFNEDNIELYEELIYLKYGDIYRVKKIDKV